MCRQRGGLHLGKVGRRGCQCLGWRWRRMNRCRAHLQSPALAHCREVATLFFSAGAHSVCTSAVHACPLKPRPAVGQEPRPEERASHLFTWRGHARYPSCIYVQCLLRLSSTLCCCRIGLSVLLQPRGKSVGSRRGVSGPSRRIPARYVTYRGPPTLASAPPTGHMTAHQWQPGHYVPTLKRATGQRSLRRSSGWILPAVVTL